MPKTLDDLAIDILTPVRRTAGPSDPASPYAETFSVDGPLGRIVCHAAGDGPVVLLVHGWDSSHRDLDAFVVPLVAAGRRAITFDLPAHGTSEGLLAAIPDLADGLAPVAAAIGPVDAIVAHSIGCAASVVAFERGLVVRRFVGIASPERYAHWVTAFATQANVDPHALIDAIGARGVDVRSLDLPRSAPQLRIPALFVHSADDRMTAIAGARRSVAAWSGARLLEVDGLGHTRILRDPAVVDAVLAEILGA